MSKHNSRPSNAIDAAPYPFPGWNVKQTIDFVYFGGYVMGVGEKLFKDKKMIHKLRYGGDFNGNQRISDSVLFDLVHFELVAGK